MEYLPTELISHLFSYLFKSSINFALVSKLYYSIYSSIRNENILIRDRFLRINSKCDAAIETNNIIITLDRMYIGKKKYKYPHLFVHAKVFFPRHMHISDHCNNNHYATNYYLYFYYTYNKWKDIQEMVMKKINTAYHSKIIAETWACKINTFCNDIITTWFAFYLQHYNNGNKLWDNNNGWNYSVDKKYHHIPQIEIHIEYPSYIDRKGTGEYFDKCAFLLFNDWLYCKDV